MPEPDDVPPPHHPGGPAASPYLAPGESVGTRIRLLRQRRGLTQEALADAIGDVTRSAVALWETGRGGEARHLPRIAEVLGVSVEFFITGMARQDTRATLTVEESALLGLYRDSDVAERLTLLRAAKRMQRRSARARTTPPRS